MPEGPSIVILRDAAAHFRNKTVRHASGNSSLDLSRMEGRRIVSVRSWGKHFLLEFRGFSLRAHLPGGSMSASRTRRVRRLCSTTAS